MQNRILSRLVGKSRLQKSNGYGLSSFKGDIFGGVTSMVVALPVSLGFGIASGLGAAAGLYGAVAVGFFASVFGGTRSQISGPTAPMTVAMAVIVTSHADNIAEALAIVVLAGLFQVALGLSRVGHFVAYTPHVVVSGFMSGIGFIIMLLQLLPALGISQAIGGPLDAMRALPDAVRTLNPHALGIAVMTLAVGFLWPRKFARIVPGPLVALLVGTILGIFWLSEAPIIGSIPTGLPELQLNLPDSGFLIVALQPAVILALLGSVDSLLTSLVADSLTGTRHNPGKELVGQGVGNIVAGLIGALPGAGATMGTVVNIRSGGSSPLSGVIRALLLLAVILGLGHVVEPIPLAALAGVLFKVGWDIVDWEFLALSRRIPRAHLFVMLTTLLLTVFVDLVTAVGIGLIAGAMVLAKELEQLELDSVVSVPILDLKFFGTEASEPGSDPYTAQVGLVALKGSFTVASSHKLVGVIGEDIKDHEVVIFDFSQATYIDDSAAMVIKQLLEVAERAHSASVMLGLSGPVEHTLRSMRILENVPENHFIDSLDEARTIARDILKHKSSRFDPTGEGTAGSSAS